MGRAKPVQMPHPAQKEIRMSAKKDEGRTNQTKDAEVRKSSEKPKTERASHQGGGGIRSDHKPQGPGAKK